MKREWVISVVGCFFMSLLLVGYKNMPSKPILSDEEIFNSEGGWIGGHAAFGGLEPNDSYFDRQWAIHNNGSFFRGIVKSGADVHLIKAWKLTTGDSNIVVAVLDGGCNMEEKDLEGRFWKNKNEIPGNGIDDDGNGYIDDYQGWDFVNYDNYPQNEDGHGTNVAGIIGANANNGIGYTGVDWNCKLMICKITDAKGFGKYEIWAKAIRYAVDNGARIINMSVGGGVPNAALDSAIEYAWENNVLVVACMMNRNTDIPFYPAASPHVLAVGATGPDDVRAAPFFWSPKSGSNYGIHLSVVAPGNYIYGLSENGYNECWAGTSQAAPVVSGIASLLLSENPKLTVEQLKQIIEFSADDMVGKLPEDKPGWDRYYGFGRVNAYKALMFQQKYFPALHH